MAHNKIRNSVKERLIDDVPTYCSNIISNFFAKITKMADNLIFTIGFDL